MIAEASYHHRYEFKMQEWIENILLKNFWLYAVYGDLEPTGE